MQVIRSWSASPSNNYSSLPHFTRSHESAAQVRWHAPRYSEGRAGNQHPARPAEYLRACHPTRNPNVDAVLVRILRALPIIGQSIDPPKCPVTIAAEPWEPPIKYKPPRSTERCMNIITVSREYGAGGGEVARRLAERLGWELLDRQLLHQAAAVEGMPDAEIEAMDEKTVGLVDRLRLHPPHERYMSG